MTDTGEPVWLLQAAVIAMHDRQLAEHGGGEGVRDIGLLESALLRPVNKFSYGERDVFKLAAAYAYGLARNHPFVDGNKRIALVSALTFLHMNGHGFRAPQDDTVSTFLALASGQLSEDQLSNWLRTNWECYG